MGYAWLFLTIFANPQVKATASESSILYHIEHKREEVANQSWPHLHIGRYLDSRDAVCPCTRSLSEPTAKERDLSVKKNAEQDNFSLRRHHHFSRSMTCDRETEIETEIHPAGQIQIARHPSASCITPCMHACPAPGR